MTFIESIQSGFRNYATFDGRSTRSEYWHFNLFAFLAMMATVLIGPFILAIALGLALPTLAVKVRRLHDIYKSGRFIFIACIPLVGPTVLLVWHCQRGTLGDNRFGPDPLFG